jgi:hypothetical protein
MDLFLVGALRDAHFMVIVFDASDASQQRLDHQPLPIGSGYKSM